MSNITPAAVRYKPISQNRSVIKDSIRRIIPMIKAGIPIVINLKEYPFFPFQTIIALIIPIMISTALMTHGTQSILIRLFFLP